MTNWEREFALWAPHLNVVTLIGNAAARDTIREHELYADADGGSKKTRDRSSLQVSSSQRLLLLRLNVSDCPCSALGMMGHSTASKNSRAGNLPQPAWAALVQEAHAVAKVPQARVKVHAIVTSYEVAMMEATELRKLEFEALVVDEGHRLKNSSSRCRVMLSLYHSWQTSGVAAAVPIRCSGASARHLSAVELADCCGVSNAGCSRC